MLEKNKAFVVAFTSTLQRRYSLLGIWGQGMGAVGLRSPGVEKVKNLTQAGDPSEQ